MTHTPGKSVPEIVTWVATADHGQLLSKQPVDWLVVDDATELIQHATVVARHRHTSRGIIPSYLCLFLDHATLGRAAVEDDADRLIDLAAMGREVWVYPFLGEPDDLTRRWIAGEDLAPVVRTVRSLHRTADAELPELTRRQAHTALQVVRSVESTWSPVIAAYAIAMLKRLARPLRHRLPSRQTRKRMVAVARQLDWDPAHVQLWFLQHRGRDYPLDTIRCVLDHAAGR